MQNNKKDIETKFQNKIQKYCAIEERCEFDVKKKLSQWGITENSSRSIIADLIKNKFLDEERFAKMFCEVKFRTRKWGRIKIIHELKRKYISEINIHNGLTVINKSDYIETLKESLQKKSESIKEIHPLKKKQKIVNFLLQRGFESNLIWDYIDIYK